MEPASAKENDVLKTFRAKIADLKLGGHKNSDLYLLSWLRARELDVPKAEDMLRKSLAWAQEYGIDKISEWEAPEMFLRELPYEISGKDKGGSPVAILPYGSWDLRKIVELGFKEDYIRYNNSLYNKLIGQDQLTPNSFTQFVYIFDMAGYSFRQLTSAAAVDTTLQVAKIFEANYPERLKTAYIVNAPKIFSLLFALVKPLLSPRTLAKVQIFSSNSSKWKVALLNNIPADQIPAKYGGTKATSANMQNLDANSAPDADTDGLLEVTVGAGEKLEAQYDVKHPNTTLSWKFKTDQFDISFGVRSGDKDVVAIERVNSHVNDQSGTFLCQKPGTYVLVFDNTYSVVRPKTLHYMVTMSSPEDSDDEDNTNL